MNPDEKEKGARSLLAIIITTFSIVGITILSIVFIMVTPPGPTRKDSAAQVFSGVLPLYGTWVGTLLAFYFAKENFEAAKDAFQTSSSTYSDLESIPASSIISTARFFSVSVESDSGKTLEDIKKELEENNRRRLPILDKKNGSLKLLVYEGDIDKYAGKQENSYQLKKLSDFIDYAKEAGDIIKSVVYVEKNISLAKADDKRRKKDGCRDIIVTENGEADSKVIGYITDRDIDQFRRSG